MQFAEMCDFFLVLLTKGGAESDALIEDDPENSFEFGSFKKVNAK
jgi:hypothetical protein